MQPVSTYLEVCGVTDCYAGLGITNDGVENANIISKINTHPLKTRAAKAQPLNLNIAGRGYVSANDRVDSRICDIDGISGVSPD